MIKVIMTKIAVVEDDRIIGQMYRIKFESENFDVKLASNGKDGIALVKAFKPDILLLDLAMPIMDGAEALREIRKDEKFKDLPVIILTNTGKEEAPKDIDELNPKAYIVKAELTPRQVLAKVKETLGLA